MKRPVRITIAVVLGLIAAGAVTSAFLGGLAWGFTLLLCTAALLGVPKLLGSEPPGERPD
jgi:hypothetical protein